MAQKSWSTDYEPQIAKIKWRAKAIGLFLKRFLASIPLIGPLAYCSWNEHRSSAREMFFILLFSTATFWLTALFLLGTQSARTLGYPNLIFSTVKAGELFIFTVGFLGPILITAGDDPDTAKQFPGRLWSLAAVFLIGVVAAGFHSQIKAAQLKGPLAPLDAEFFYNASLYVAIAAVVLRYLSMVYRKSTFSPKDEIRDPVDKFATTFDERHAADAGQTVKVKAPDAIAQPEDVDAKPLEDFEAAFEAQQAGRT